MFKRSPEFTDIIYNFNDNTPNKETRMISDIKSTYNEMNANVNGSVTPYRLMMTMIENIPQFQDLKTQQDAYECFSCLYNTILRTSAKDQLAQLFEFETSIQTSPITDIEGGMSEFITEKDF